MGRINTTHRSYLEHEFGNRVSFRKTERKLYGHDIAALPGLIKLLIGNVIPDAVVQPSSEQELVKLVRWAAEHNIPLTPRSKATTGYGGVLPVKQGVVIDFYHMKNILNIDSHNMTATVQPGIVWQKLDRELEKQGLALRLYPSSYPAATVGGWLAQGGAGIGSFESGWFQDNVLSARAVTPDGQVRTFSGEDLDLVSEAGGVTGFISEVTIRLQPKEELEVTAIGSLDAAALQSFFQALIEEKVPVWSALFINPLMAELKNVVPLREHLGNPVEERVNLPGLYITTLAFKASDKARIMEKLNGILKRCRSEKLSDSIARHEWENRFKIMAIKRLGPSLVPAEVVIPLSSLGKVMEELERQVRQPMVKEGIIT